MKTLVAFLSIVCFCFCLNLPAQTSVEGIYLSAIDYTNHNLSFTSSKENKVKIKLNAFSYKPYIKVLTSNSAIKLSKDSVFGFRDSKQNDFRFNNNDERVYKIIENKTKIIYSTQVQAPSDTGKSIKLITAYFYSNTLTSPILPLIKN